MNKKAQIFETMLVIVVFSVCVIALISFLAHGQKEKVSLAEIHPAVSIYSEQKEIELYAEESGKLAVQKAFYETLRNMEEECQSSAENINYIVWKKECLMKNDRLKEKFVYNVNASMQEFSDIKPKSISIEDDKILFDFGQLQLNSSLKKTVKIDVNYLSDISFSINLSSQNIDLDFEKLYLSILDKWETCKKESDIVKAKACLNSLNIAGWKLAIRNDDFFCGLTSEQSYYIDGKFSPMTVRLKLEK